MSQIRLFTMTTSDTKNQIQISLNQPLRAAEKDYGSLYVSGTWQDYWNGEGSNSNYNVGYNNSFAYGSYSLSLQRTYDQRGQQDDSVYLSLSVPLSVFSQDNSRLAGFSNVNMGLRSDLKGGTNFNSSASGNTQDNKVSYSVSTSSSSGNYGNLNQISGYSSLNSSYGPLGVSASFGDDNSKQFSASYSGGMVAHAGGIAFAPGSIGDNDAIAVVKASGAKGAVWATAQAQLTTPATAFCRICPRIGKTGFRWISGPSKTTLK